MSERTCECGAEVKVKGRCRRCYDREAKRAKYQATPWPETCSYSAAHLRVTRAKGRAAEHVCPCGEQGQEWSYRGGAPTEQRGERTRWSNGKPSTAMATWTTDPDYYDALCVPCHAKRDGRTDYGKGYRNDPSKAAEYASKRRVNG